MKVAFFLGALNQGGMESLILDICRHNPVFDHTVLYRKDGVLTDWFKQTGTRLVKIEKRNLLKYIHDLRKCVKKENFEIIHSQTPSNTLLLSIALLGLSKIRVITTFHGFTFVDAPLWYRKIVYAKSDVILCVSDYEKHLYTDRWKLPEDNKFDVLYNGVDCSRLDHFSERMSLPNEYTKKNLVMVGSFRDGRDQMHIIKGIVALDEEDRRGFDLFFVGNKVATEPHRYDDCVRYCQEAGLGNVHFLGGRKDVPSILNAMDAFVYCSEHDTFGIAVIEAMAAGLPVVVNDWAVMKEVCSLDGVDNPVIFYETGSVESCAGAIKDLLWNMDWYKEKAKAIAPLVREKYSIEKNVDNLYKIYSELLSRKSKRSHYD